MRWILLAYIIAGLVIDYKLTTMRRKCRTAVQPKTEATIHAAIIFGWLPLFLFFLYRAARQVRKRR